MIVYFNTVRRKRPVRDGGELVKLDWNTKRVLKRVPLFPEQPDIDHDPNPRGNSRGGKGMLLQGDHLLVGTYHTLLLMNRDLEVKKRISNHLFANIHELWQDNTNSENNGTWVSATTIDCALKIDRRGNTLKTWWPREEPLLRETLSLVPMDIDKKADNRLKYLHAELSTKDGHTHLNAVTGGGGRTYALLNKPGALVQIEPDVRIVLHDRRLRGAHSPVITADGQYVLLCGSFRKTIMMVRLSDGELHREIQLMDFPEITALHHQFPDQPFNRSIFVRGLEIIDEQRILAGIAPASILEIDITHHRLLDIYRHANDVGDTVHGLVHEKCLRRPGGLF